MPQWYLDTGLPAADADSDGIPDAWERRTFGDPSTPDSNADRDGDGLTDLEEFAFGSDPRTFSTMGDGWSDKEKRDAGLGAVYRVCPASGLAQWLSWLGWSEQQWHALTATNWQGFATCYADFVNGTPPYSQERGTADFWLVTRTDRPAWVTVGDALTTNSFPVQAGSGRVRIRAAYGGPVSLAIDPLPGSLAELPGATNGLWLCQVSVEPYRTNTVVFSDNETPTVDGQPDSVDGLLLLTPPPAASIHSLTSASPAVAMQPLRMTDGATVLGDGGWYCLCYSDPPCDWPTYGMIGCDTVSMSINGVQAGTPLMDKEEARELFDETYPAIQRTIPLTVANATYPFIYGKLSFAVRACEAHGGVSGAEQHPPWHEPNYDDQSLCSGIGCSCDGGPHWVVGFDHAAVNTRNLNHPDEPAADKLYQHCLGVVWDGQPLDLKDLCESCGLDLAGLVVFEANGIRVPSAALNIGAEPRDLAPAVFRIKMLDANLTDIVWDRLILVVNNKSTKQSFDAWYGRFSVETNWLTELPAAYRKVNGPPTTNLFGQVRMLDPEPSTTNLWANKVDQPGAYMHHIAKWQMRSKETAHGHGNQACYDSQDLIILSGVSAGSADYGCADGYNPLHVEHDVEPFVRALQLDGNPCRRSLWSLTHALMYDGDELHRYRKCRPATPNAKALLDPGERPQ